jgi:DNA-directed RNA polymerase specialized sigma24 family protein
VTTVFDKDWAKLAAMAQHLVSKTININQHLTWADHSSEMLQEARLVVWEARTTYKPGPAKFSTYAYAAIRNALHSYSRSRRAGTRQVALDTTPSSFGDPAEIVGGGLDSLVELLRATRNGELLLLAAIGFRDWELGPRDRIRKRRNRATHALRAQLALT